MCTHNKGPTPHYPGDPCVGQNEYLAGFWVFLCVQLCHRKSNDTTAHTTDGGIVTEHYTLVA